MRRLLAPLTARVGERMAGSRVAPIGRRVAGTETGVLLGYLAQRVLGQYDLLVLDDDAAADAVYYVGGNILALEKRFAFRPRDFRLWIAIHEVTHRAQFTGVPWMKPYYLSLVESTLSSIDPDPRRLVQALARAADEFRNGRNPLDDGGLVALLASDEQRGALANVQALMSLLEGHGNSVMNQLGREHVAGQARMARVLHARRQSAGMAAFLQKLVGLESKMRQYEVGEAFVAAVEREAGPAAIDAAWRGPEFLPTIDELSHPNDWLARVDARERDPGHRVGGGPARAVARAVRDRGARARSRRSSSRAPAAPTRSRCSRSRPTPASPRSRCTSTTAAAGERRRGEGGRDDRDAAGRASSGRCGSPVTAGPNLEARARDARYGALERDACRARRRRSCSSATPPTTRPRPCCSTCCAGAAASGLAGMAPRHGHVVRPLLGFRRGRHARAVRRARASSVLTDPMNDDRTFRRVAIRHDVLPMLVGTRGARPGPGPRPPGRHPPFRVGVPRRAGRRAWPDADPPSARALGALAAAPGPPRGAPLARRAATVDGGGRAGARGRGR